MITPSIHGWGDWHQDAWSGGKANGRVGNFPSLEVIRDGIPNGRMDFLKEKINPNHFLIHDIHRNSSGHPNFFLIHSSEILWLIVGSWPENTASPYCSTAALLNELHEDWGPGLLNAFEIAAVSNLSQGLRVRLVRLVMLKSSQRDSAALEMPLGPSAVRHTPTLGPWHWQSFVRRASPVPSGFPKMNSLIYDMSEDPWSIQW